MMTEERDSDGFSPTWQSQSESHIRNYFRTFRFFEYRKCCRLYAGSFNSSISGILSTALILLWLISFAISSIKIDTETDSITLTFQNWTSQTSPISESNIFLWLGLGLNVIVLVLVLIAIVWHVHMLSEITFTIMLISTIILVALRVELLHTSFSISEYGTMSVAYLSIQFVTAGLLADLVAYYLWSVFLLPAILRWQWSKLQNKDGERILAFPIFRLICFLVYAVLVLPLWILIVGSYILLFILQLLGMPFVARSAFEFMTLHQSAWDFTLLRHDSDYYSYSTLDLAISYKFATWRTAITPYIARANASNTFTYVGEVNASGIPEGFGKYRDSEHQVSEILVGQWKNGLPVAPFHSREQSDFGGTFVGIRIGFVCMTTVPMDAVTRCTNFRCRPLDYGVSSTECCVSGKFYREFPNASNILCCSPSFDLMWETLLETIGEGSAAPQRLAVGTTEDFKYNDCETESSAQSSTAPELEVLIFIHGYNSTLLQAMELLGQMLCLASMPSHIIPIVFNWPGGYLSTYYGSQKVAQGERIAEIFENFVGRVRDKGISKIHLLSHSMGARTVMACVVHSQFTFSQIILAQPEINLIDFRAHACKLVAHCKNVTVYVNRGDFALWCSEKFNRTWDLQGPWIQRVIGTAQPSLGRASLSALVDLDGILIPRVDVIDTSNMASNINQIRHSFFHLSRESIEDIREVLITKRTASHRQSRLIGREGSNVYDVAVAPLFYKV